MHRGPQATAPPHAFGVPCRGARTLGAVAAALDWALAQTGPSVVETFVDPASYGTTVDD